MPTLEWIGKDKVVNHHLDVPYRVLEHRYTYRGNGESGPEIQGGNKIIRGDNLEALKALLPQYEGRVKCIYIDPPYNTGNEGWVYNDNVNDPRIKKWLGEVVGKEGEDLSRHDKWLCMMYPRLRLLQRLLDDDGAIFISIENNELYNLKLLCDEIYGPRSFVANIVWQRTYSPRNDSKGIPTETDSILVYSKVPGWQPGRLERTAAMDARYKSPDNDPRLWKSGDASAPGAATHPGMVYAIQHPITGKLLYPTTGRCWTYGQEQMLSFMREWAEYELRPLDDYAKRTAVCGTVPDKVPLTIDAIVLARPFEEIKEQTRKRYDDGIWPVLYFTNKGKGGIACKRHLDTVENRMVTNLWPYVEVGHTDEASKELKAVFDGQAVFDTPKPMRLLERVLQIATDDASIILDSFAGSGTTAHAVLNLNKQDGGNRKFILVEMMDYAESVTAERVRRVIDGYADVEGTGGSFSFYELGEPLLLENKFLNENLPILKIREYVWFMETKTPLPDTAEVESFLLGLRNNTAYYFFYERDSITTLDHAFLERIQSKADAYLIYADMNTLSDHELERHNIVFKKIPRDIARL
ncbi:MAG: site-specific DNA-methyltransferase [Deltaproteobacteria bacterium]|jgi:adenine-specific DNA-methyltransferase|nr:site-specific DNA-methyltransferase [Deltaproteobacteria bacterium]